MDRTRRQLIFGTGEPPIHIKASCLPYAGVECRVCGDVCPEAAIRFRPQLGQPARPEVDLAACTGCGECIDRCPLSAIEAGPGIAERSAGAEGV